jgi:hypothetical protein
MHRPDVLETIHNVCARVSFTCSEPMFRTFKDTANYTYWSVLLADLEILGSYLAEAKQVCKDRMNEHKSPEGP